MVQRELLVTYRGRGLQLFGRAQLGEIYLLELRSQLDVKEWTVSINLELPMCFNKVYLDEFVTYLDKVQKEDR